MPDSVNIPPQTPMKRYKLPILAALVAALTLGGCGQLDRLLIRQQVAPGQTVVTTDAAGQVEAVISPPVTNYVVSPAVATVTAVAGALPIPWAGTVASLLGLGASLYVGARRRRLTVALVEGIEAGRVLLQASPEGRALDAQVRDALIHHQEIAGVLGAAATLVSKYTQNTVK